MRDDDRAGILEQLIARDVIQMIVGVHQIADRLWRDLADFAQERLGGAGLEETVDHQNRIVADDETGIRVSYVADRGIDPRPDLLQHKWRRRRLGCRRKRQQIQDGQDRAQPLAQTHDRLPDFEET